MNLREQHLDLFDLACDHFQLSQQAWVRGDTEAFIRHCDEHRRIAKAAHDIFRQIEE